MNFAGKKPAPTLAPAAAERFAPVFLDWDFLIFLGFLGFLVFLLIRNCADGVRLGRVTESSD